VSSNHNKVLQAAKRERKDVGSKTTWQLSGKEYKNRSCGQACRRQEWLESVGGSSEEAADLKKYHKIL
jgi:hypothetical protein